MLTIGGSIPTMMTAFTLQVLARVNIAGDLVIGTGEETCLVCIRHGRLTITRKIADDVVNVSDEPVACLSLTHCVGGNALAHIS